MRDLLQAVRAHVRRAVDEGAYLSTAVKTFDGKRFQRLQHADTWLLQLLNQQYLEIERE